MARAAQLRKGSFRGAPFLYQDATSEGGRRTAQHEYPLREKGFVEDLGRKLRSFSLDIFVLGDDWQSQRDALLDKLDKPGPGPLVHPLFGAMTVSVESWRTVERADQLGRADFQVTFVEAGDISFAATNVAAPGSQVTGAAAAANDAAAASFAQRFATSGLPAWLQGAAVGDINSALDAVQAAAKRAAGLVQSAVAPVQGTVANLGATITTVEQSIANVESSAFNLLSTPATLATQLQGAVSGLSLLGVIGAADWNDVFAGLATPGDGAIGAVLAAQRGIAVLGTDAAPVAPSVPPAPAAAALNPDRQQQARNSDALFALIRVAALAEAVQAAVAQPYDSAADAAAERDRLADLIDAEMLRDSDSAVIAALQALRLAMVRELNAIAAKLPPLLSFTPNATLPAVVLAHRLYDDPSWAEDIVKRNRIRHPLFVPGGKPLEVLGNSTPAAPRRRPT